jgi:predicted NBD/HSP70 family sugar kinase
MPNSHDVARLKVIDALRRLGPVSRQGLVVATGLSRATLVKLLPDMVDGGPIIEEPGDGAPRPGRTGRRPATLRLNPQSGAVMCISFRAETVDVGVADMAADLVHVQSQPLNTPFVTLGEAFDCAAALTQEVIAASGIDRSRLLAVGLSIPAPIDRRTGAIASSGILRGWNSGIPAEEMHSRLLLPVLVDNDANLAALAELRFGAGRGRDDFIYVLASGGIGSALVLNGRLYPGATGLAGELAHTVIDPDGPVCRCGNRGCLSAAYDVRAQLSLLHPVVDDSVGVDGIVRLVRERDRATLGVVRDAGAAIGRILAGFCNELNPSAIVLGGEFASPGMPLIDAVRQALDRYALPAIADEIELVRGSLGDRAELAGAAAMVIEDLEQVPSSRLMAFRQPGAERGWVLDGSSAVA